MATGRTPGTKRGPTKRAAATSPIKKRAPASRAILAKLRPLCLAQPDATEVLAWGEPTWRVGGGKIFAQYDDHHHGAEHVSVHLAAPDGAQQALIEADPERFFRPPYVGHRGWIGVVLDTDPDWGMVAGLVEQAYGVIKHARKR